MNEVFTQAGSKMVFFLFANTSRQALGPTHPPI